MKRRTFIKSMGAMGLTASIPASLTLQSLVNNAYADSPDYAAVNFAAPDLMPQVINIFLYGGPSELSGNLSNIGSINANSQNAYPAGMLEDLDFANFNANGPDSGRITPNNFWAGAGGIPLEFMLKYNHMSVYRTIMKQKEPTRSHRESLFMSLKGTLDIENSPGFGTRLALVLAEQNRLGSMDGIMLADETTSVSSIDDGLLGFKLPFVSFEGTSTIFAPDPDNPLNDDLLRLRGLTLNANFENPYSRSGNNEEEHSVLDSLVAKVRLANRYQEINQAFALRAEMEKFIGKFSSLSGNDVSIAMPDAARDGFTIDPEDADFFNDAGVLEYPNTQFTDRIRSAVILAVENQESLFITVGGGLGGWDDHNNGMDQYPERMEGLMSVLRVAMLHIKYTDRSRAPGGTPLSVSGDTPDPVVRRTDNIVINMYGDFGRLVNLNNSNGWDHANNQNLFTFGGAGIRPGGAAALGKIVGTTRREGASGTNNQYTVPTEGSYTAEPMSISSSIYSYFGVTNPQVMTRDTVTGLNPDGDPALDESQASVNIANASFV